jgi:hypothetical protein
MKCYIQKIDHSQCPKDETGKNTACYADPCAVLAEHQKTAVFTICGNEAVPGDYMCEICKAQYDGAMTARQKAIDETTARAAAFTALAEAALTSEGGPDAGTEQ